MLPTCHQLPKGAGYDIFFYKKKMLNGKQADNI